MLQKLFGFPVILSDEAPKNEIAIVFKRPLFAETGMSEDKVAEYTAIVLKYIEEQNDKQNQ